MKPEGLRYSMGAVADAKFCLRFLDVTAHRLLTEPKVKSDLLEALAGGK